MALISSHQIMVICSFLFILCAGNGNENKKTRVLIKDTPQTNFIPDLGDGETYINFIQKAQIWVDKSLLIKEIFTGDKSVFVITAPRCWGKTTNAEMFTSYCKLPLSLDGEITPIEDSANYKYFKHGEVNGQKLKNEAKPMIHDFEDSHLANHPVIEISSNVLCINDGIDGFRALIRTTFNQHIYLKYKLSNDIKKNPTNYMALANLQDFNLFSSHESIDKMSPVRLRNSIMILSRILYQTYNRKVIISMDEYDYFARKAYLDSRRSECSSINPQIISDTEIQFFNSLGDFMHATFKSNPYYEKALITGRLLIQDTAFIYNWNPAEKSSIFDFSGMFPYYGIHDHEFDELLEYKNELIPLKDKAKRWYNGYASLGHPDIRSYSTYSVVEFLRNEELRSYLDLNAIPNSITSLIQDSFSFQRDIVLFLSTWQDGNENFIVSYQNYRWLTLQDCKTISNILSYKMKYSSPLHKNIMFSFLAISGFATPHRNSVKHLNKFNLIGESDVSLVVPNEDVYRHFYWHATKLMKIRIAQRFLKFGECFVKARITIVKYMKEDTDKRETIEKIGSIIHNLFDISTNGLGFSSIAELKETIRSASKDLPYSRLMGVPILTSEIQESVTTGNEFIAKTYINIIFHMALSSFPFMPNNPLIFATKLKQEGKVIDLFKAMDTTALIVEVKYARFNYYNPNEPAEGNDIQSAFEQCIGYSVGYYKMFGSIYERVKFLAIRVHYDMLLEIWSTVADVTTVQLFEEVVLKYRKHTNKTDCPLLTFFRTSYDHDIPIIKITYPGK